LLCLLTGGALHALDLPSAPAPTFPASGTANRTDHVVIPRLNGEPRLNDFLNESLGSPAAKQMLRVTDFIQRFPNDGQPSTESTVAYLGYTREYFYAAFVCRDRTPAGPRSYAGARFSGRR
jgi:hypothetical protein